MPWPPWRPRSARRATLPLALFALGRTAGWIAHAIEQYTLDHLIIPPCPLRGARPKNLSVQVLAIARLQRLTSLAAPRHPPHTQPAQ